MKFELFNRQDELVLSVEIHGVGKSWIHPGPVTSTGDTSLLEWFNTPAYGDMMETFFNRAARKHGLRYECDTFHIRP